ncbi:RNA-binding protein 38-like isoform X1 [Tachypleus tridentatus]|uniref:RNA-binding protein 38-like isoform X1 n=1 Tax=Tachypleus tridentatus TaxID=6853 RepID=UPI003FD3D93A
MSEAYVQLHPSLPVTNGSQQRDTTFTKIFVGGLPYHTTDKSLRQFFEGFGEIEEAVVITDRQTGKSRGYGFVTMSDRSAAERAVKDANPVIDGRKANVNLAYLGAKPKGNTVNGFPVPVRAGIPTVLPSQYSLSPQYLYPSPYVTSSSILLPPNVPFSSVPAAAWHFYDYAAAYHSAQFANGLDSLPYTYPSATSAPSTGHSNSPYLQPQVYPYTFPTVGFTPYAPQPQIQEPRL